MKQECFPLRYNIQKRLCVCILIFPVNGNIVSILVSMTAVSTVPRMYSVQI
jgi:hypothetical protein